MNCNKPKAVELFAGAGGLGVGLEQAGFDIVLANEIEGDFARTFEMNHPKTKMICDDIHTIDFRSELSKLDVGEVVLVSGGPPCQGFSTVGSKRRQDPRNSLFFEYLRAVREIDPLYTLFENVSGFKKLYNGEAYGRLLQELKDLGYQVASAVIEASNYGLPQIRQRTIVVGWKGSQAPVRIPPRPNVHKGPNLFNLPDRMSLIDAISDLPELSFNDSSSEYKCEPLNEYQRKMRNGCRILTEHNSSNYGEKMREILSLIPEGGSVLDLPERLRPKSYFNNTYARLRPDRPAPTITRNFGTPSSSRCVHPYQNRALSTREGARLQGFPDDYAFHGSKGSKNLQIGNAVPPVFGRIIAEEIIRSLEESQSSVILTKANAL